MLGLTPCGPLPPLPERVEIGALIKVPRREERERSIERAQNFIEIQKKSTFLLLLLLLLVRSRHTQVKLSPTGKEKKERRRGNLPGGKRHSAFHCRAGGAKECFSSSYFFLLLDRKKNHSNRHSGAQHTFSSSFEETSPPSSSSDRQGLTMGTLLLFLYIDSSTLEEHSDPCDFLTHE